MSCHVSEGRLPHFLPSQPSAPAGSGTAASRTRPTTCRLRPRPRPPRLALLAPQCALPTRLAPCRFPLPRALPGNCTSIMLYYLTRAAVPIEPNDFKVKLIAAKTVTLNVLLAIGGWLAGWVAGWLGGCLAGWVAACLVGWLPGWLAGWLKRLRAGLLERCSQRSTRDHVGQGAPAPASARQSRSRLGPQNPHHPTLWRRLQPRADGRRHAQQGDQLA
jgi:hypothetical protein